jgi:hypothetical protein
LNEYVSTYLTGTFIVPNTTDIKAHTHTLITIALVLEHEQVTHTHTHTYTYTHTHTHTCYLGCIFTLILKHIQVTLEHREREVVVLGSDVLSSE